MSLPGKAGTLFYGAHKTPHMSVFAKESDRDVKRLGMILIIFENEGDDQPTEEPEPPILVGPNDSDE
ncbi:MAG: hypothetical protein NVSMB44_40880 [Ktedonobacteraceae bacterium]